MTRRGNYETFLVHNVPNIWRGFFSNFLKIKSWLLCGAGGEREREEIHANDSGLFFLSFIGMNGSRKFLCSKCQWCDDLGFVSSVQYSRSNLAVSLFCFFSKLC